MEFEECSYPFDNWREHEWKALNEWVKEYGRIVKPLYRDNTCRASVMVEK
jgi:hypothetical protein